MVEQWRDCVAIVTGASSGIGAEISIQLAKNGLKVVALARRLDNMLEIKGSLHNFSTNYYPIKCDVTKEEDILAAFQWIETNLGGVHVLVNNAGIAKFKSNLYDGKTSEWKDILDTNLLGLCIASREAIKSMMKNNIAGLIIHINSIVGHGVSPITGSYINMYGASKNAVTAAAEILRLELAYKKSQIRVSSISPGGVESEILEKAGSPVKCFSEHFTGAVPLKPLDIANAVLYLLSTPKNVNVTELKIRPTCENM